MERERLARVEPQRRQRFSNAFAETVGKSYERPAERQVSVSEVRIEANGLPRVPLRAVELLGVGREAADLA